ncbi:TetR/AcrR family transcriptional regulator [Nocardia asteroides]|uniref:TetR/AcrR family transcriptional regulator n=1 Tax=Nocardia asteroides TaxID=1824 RepID=UPI0037CA74BD
MPTRRSYHHGDLRAALVTYAEQALREKGVGGLSLRELARDLGVSPGAPNRHFSSKQALLDALALEGFDRLQRQLDAALDEAGDSFAEQLAAFTRTGIGFAAANPALVDLMYSAKHDPTASEDLAAASLRLLTLVTRMIERGQARGEVREGPSEGIGLPVMVMINGFVTLTVSGGIPAESVERGLTDMVAFTLHGCAP